MILLNNIQSLFIDQYFNMKWFEFAYNVLNEKPTSPSKSLHGGIKAC